MNTNLDEVPLDQEMDDPFFAVRVIRRRSANLIAISTPPIPPPPPADVVISVGYALNEKYHSGAYHCHFAAGNTEFEHSEYLPEGNRTEVVIAALAMALTLCEDVPGRFDVAIAASLETDVIAGGYLAKWASIDWRRQDGLLVDDLYVWEGLYDPLRERGLGQIRFVHETTQARTECQKKAAALLKRRDKRAQKRQLQLQVKS